MADRKPPRRPLDHDPAAVTYARTGAGLTMTELARLAGVSVSLISEIEGGSRNATPDLLGRMAEVLHCPRVVLERKACVAAWVAPDALRYARQRAGLTMHEVIRATGLAHRALTEWETIGGVCPQIDSLASVLNCPPSVLQYTPPAASGWTCSSCGATGNGGAHCAFCGAGRAAAACGDIEAVA